MIKTDFPAQDVSLLLLLLLLLDVPAGCLFACPCPDSMYRCYSRLINRKSCANYRPAITFPQFSLVELSAALF